MNQPRDVRIAPAHHARQAIVYVRQSSAEQVHLNVESTRMQIGLREKAIALGWRHPTVISDDLGLSAGGYVDRPGFQRLPAQVAARQVGIILCLDASRLSRNSKDWASLFELCGFFGTLVADLDQIYDLSLPNDRLVLGIKGTVAELELSLIKRRLKMGSEAKAARGELKFIVPPGYAHDPDGKIVMDPDRRVREAIVALFDQFDRSTSVRQLALWYRDTKTAFPVRKVRKSRTTAWEVPTSSTLQKLIEHPIYAGVYVYGRRNERVEYRDGRLVKRLADRLPLDQCRVCIHDHHAAYISWARYLANQARIAESRPRWRMSDNRGAVRDGLALLTGLLRCGHCGTKLFVGYKTASALYYCDGGTQIKGERRCLSFGSMLIDQRVATELCRALSPACLEASRVAVEHRRRQRSQEARQAELQVEAAQYEADRALEQFDLVDPKNRLVADTLEERLNQKLTELQDARRRLAKLVAADEPLTEAQCRRIDQLGRDFPAAWNHPRADPVLKKRILRAAIREVIVLHEPEQQRLAVTIHWQGGVHTRIHVPKRATPVGSRSDPSLIEAVRNLATLSDAEIARILNMKKLVTPRGLRWSQDRVRDFRGQHHIRLAPPPDSAHFMTGQQVAARLGISRHGVEGLLRVGAIRNQRVTDFAPWRIPRADVESDAVRKLVETLKRTGRLPQIGGCPDHQLPLLPMKSDAPQEGAS
ncbi:MAG: recombinase family protein [Myxococcota bacterium]|nr:recombinase family protein [Myxococcota bacterium]